MHIHKNFSLKDLTTFGFDVKAKQLITFESPKELQAILDAQSGPYFVLGGGSNVCFTQDIEQIVLHNQIKGISIVKEDDKNAWVEVGAGENWHQLVMWAVGHHLGGIENLALIPGTVGAAPIQNIGAYGVELKDVFISLNALDISSKKIVAFNASDCEFGYRDSFFKKEGKGRYIILNIQIKLQKAPHQLRLAYGAIRQVLTEKGIDNPSIKDVSEAVIQIRQSKLPDPKIIGNAGSFFKNPVVSKAQFQKLFDQFEDLVYFPQEDGTYKIPAGWLIEKCGWKGKRIGNVGCHKDQALVLVHFGGGKGSEILNLATAIQKNVLDIYGIQLQPEVNIV